MKTLRTFSKLITVVAIIAMVLSFASCINKGGALELKSFTVDRSSVKTNYLIGEEIDFSGIKATVKYSDETLNTVYTYNDLKITYDEDITATVGEKFVTVSFADPHLNVEQKTQVAIKVTAEPIVDEEDPLVVAQFEKPANITAFESANADTDNENYGATDFSGKFAVGGKTYVIGNANEFKFNPIFSVLGENDIIELESFYATVEISIKSGNEYVALTKNAEESNIVKYYNGETLIATVDTYNGKYQFSEAANGITVKISVLPNEQYYISDDPAVVLEAEVINAYNVYEAWQLSVIDNCNSEWDDIKTENGIKGLNVAGIVLHKDIKITTADVPASFFYTTEKEVEYTNSVTNEKITIPAGTKYLKDHTHVYQRNGAADFAIQGNFFTIDASGFPLVPSPGVFSEDSGFDYGSDFSNATLIRFSTIEKYNKTRPEDVAEITIDNIGVIGNAKRDNLIDSTEKLASAGGLIFLKSSHHSEITINNTIGNSYFITYFADYGGDIYATAVKCYDSYQNAAMVWGNSELKFTYSFLNGCGGPVIIAQSVPDENEHPVLEVTNSKVETHVTGQEVWFESINASAIIGQITALGGSLHGAGLGNFVDANGKMNIKGLLMHNGTDAAVVIGGVDAQGKMFFDGKGIDRTQSAENVHWATIKGISEYAVKASGMFPPFLTVNDAAGNAHTIYYNGTTLVDLANAPISSETHAALCAAFVTADTITLTQGGISVTFEFYHYQ